MIAKRLTRDDIYIADEAFFTGTAAEVTPIRELDGRVIGAGKAGPITKTIQKAFFDVVTGKDKKHRKWLTPVKVEVTEKDLPLHCPTAGRAALVARIRACSSTWRRRARRSARTAAPSTSTRERPVKGH